LLRRQLHHGLAATGAIAAALVNLVRDIDEDGARSIARHLADKRYAQPLRLVQEFICRFSVTDHTDYAVRGVPVLQHCQLSTACHVRAWLDRWLAHVSATDLEELIRFFVVGAGKIWNEAAEIWGTLLSALTSASPPRLKSSPVGPSDRDDTSEGKIAPAPPVEK
jgi:hypothetical protein